MAMSDVVFTEEISGYLLKWTNIIKGYQKRWFLVKNGLLSYYRNPESVGRRCRGTFDLSHAILSAPDNQTSFIITEITGRRHHLKAMSDEDKTRWINILTSVIEKSHSSADVESDTFSEDSHFPPNIGSRCSRGSSGRQRRLFRNRPRSDQRLSFRHSSSPNLPQGNGLAFENASGTASPPSSQSPKISAETTPRLLYNPRTLFDPARFNFDSVAFPYSESSTVVRKTDSGISHTLSQIRRSSASTELTAILELVSSVETFRQRLNEHTSLVCTQLLAMENLLSTPEINLILADLARSHPNSDDLKTLGITDAKQLASRLLFMVKENRSSVKDFHATYSEALQFLVNNFSRWHQRVQAEQERCVGLERTVEQLARQHRALEIQLSQCYSYPTEELSMDGIVIRCPRGSTLGRGECPICKYTRVRC